MFSSYTQTVEIKTIIVCVDNNRKCTLIYFLFRRIQRAIINNGISILRSSLEMSFIGKYWTIYIHFRRTGKLSELNDKRVLTAVIFSIALKKY